KFLIHTIYFHPDRPADSDRIGGVRPPGRNRHIAVRAGRDGAEQIDFGEELEVIALFGRTGFDEILMAVLGQSCHLKDVQHVVHVALTEAIGRDGAHQIRVATDVQLFASQHLVNVRIAARAQQVVAPRAVIINAITDAVTRHGGHRAQIWQTRPEPVEHPHMRAVQLLRASRPETFARVVEVPCVEVNDLRPFDGDDPANLTCEHRPGFAGTDRNDEAINELAPFNFTAESTVKGLIYKERGTEFRFVKWAGHSIVSLAKRLANRRAKRPMRSRRNSWLSHHFPYARRISAHARRSGSPKGMIRVSQRAFPPGC